MKLSKLELSLVAATIEATNWIFTGDAKEDSKDFLIDKATKRFSIFNARQLKDIIRNTTIHNNDVLNDAIKMGLR